MSFISLLKKTYFRDIAFNETSKKVIRLFRLAVDLNTYCTSRWDWGEGG
jgi:hypothetical protein